MTKEEIIDQLHSLRAHCASKIADDEPEGVWLDDVIALGFAITEAKRGLVREFCNQYRVCEVCPLNGSRKLYLCGGYEWADENELDMVIAEIMALGDGGKAERGEGES